VAASRSSDPGEQEGSALRRAVRWLDKPSRLCLAGALAVPVSLLLPWYGIPISDLSQTGLAAFGFAHLALLITVGAALLLVMRMSAGHPLPRPLREGTLVAAAGVWATLLVGYLMLDRPDQLADSTRVGLRFGVFVALAGTLALMLGGLRLRSEQVGSTEGESPADTDV
jgi:hypothetical protein